jgi:PAS domain S-box-containing protein
MPDELIHAGDDPLRRSIRDFIDQVSSGEVGPASPPLPPGFPLRMLDEAPIGIYLVQEGQIIYGNWWLREFSGYPLSDLPLPALSMIVPEDRVMVADQMARRIRGEQALPSYTVGFLKKDGTAAPVQLFARLATYRDQPAILGSIMDISEKVAYERKLQSYAAELEQGQRLRQLFSDLLSHDLLNRLWVMEHLLRSLHDEQELGPRAREVVSALENSVAKALTLVRDTKTYMRISGKRALRMERLELNRLLADVLDELKTQLEEKRITARLPRTGVTLTAGIILKDVFSNLISNAVKYSPPGSEVDIEAQAGETVTVRVRDRGPGIPDAHKARIFQRFERLAGDSIPGAGLGLAIVKRIMELHQGTVRVEDNPGGGSVFVVELPALPPSPPADSHLPAE